MTTIVEKIYLAPMRRLTEAICMFILLLTSVIACADRSPDESATPQAGTPSEQLSDTAAPPADSAYVKPAPRHVATSSTVAVLNWNGTWKLKQIVYLYDDTSGMSEAHRLNENSSIVIDDKNFDYSFHGVLGPMDYQCRLDSVEMIGRKYYKGKDVNAHLRGTSYWYGYRRDRGDSVMSVQFFCPETHFSFEYFSNDTLGYFDDRRLFLFARNSRR